VAGTTTIEAIEIDGILADAKALRKRLDDAEGRIREREKTVSTIVKSVEAIGGVDGEKFRAFFKKPYVTLPFKGNEILVVVPRFIDFQVGWLHQQTETYNVFRFSQYAAWLGEAPQDLLDLVGAKREVEGTVIGDTLQFEPDDQSKIKAALGKHLEKYGEGTAKIKKGHEFDLIADMIQKGCLPFRPHPVEDADRKAPESTFRLRPYQQRAFNRFMETGAIGVFHPTGAGKSYVALKCADALKGKKLVIVPTITLKEQWENYIRALLPSQFYQFTIATYQTRSKEILEGKYMLMCLDEAQKLPANTFSRMALVNAKYRIGLSASPFREDGREAYIFALTGWPVGLDWKEYMKETGQEYHPVKVWVVKDEEAKIRQMKRLLDPAKKTLIFSDSIEIGQRISAALKIPHVWGDTVDRMKTLSESRVVVASRVADLGISIKDLEHIIEVDFLWGSRQQELQRTGRLMHTEMEKVRHDILMTREEVAKYGKRLWSLQERGFQVEVEEMK